MQELTGRRGRPSGRGAELLPLLGIQPRLLSFSPFQLFLFLPSWLTPGREKSVLSPWVRFALALLHLLPPKQGMLPNFKRTDQTHGGEVSLTTSDYCLDFRTLSGPQVSEKQVLKASATKLECKQPSS